MSLSMTSVHLRAWRVTRDALRQGHDHPWCCRVTADAVALFEMGRKPGVVLQPPQRGFRNDQEVGAALPQPFQFRDAGGAVRWIVAGVRPVLGLGKVPAAATGKPEKFVVSLAEHQNRRTGRNDGVYQTAYASDERVVVRPSPLGVRRPWRSPLLLPAL